jgi:hypothetical protein
MKAGGTLAFINATNASPPDCPGFPLTNEWAAASTASSEVLCIGGFFELDPEVSRLCFRFQPVSLKQISSIAILADARIPIQMESLVGTGSIPQQTASTEVLDFKSVFGCENSIEDI